MDQTKGIECGSYMPWIGTAVAVGYAVYLTLKSRAEKKEKTDECINKCHQKDNSKVVDTFDIEDMGNKTIFCRCWQSKKFPYCDGSHNKHNDQTGDNVGPLIIQRKAA